MRRVRAPEMLDARVGPANALLVRVRGVVLLGDVVTEEEIGQRLEAVRVAAGDVDRDRVVVADVLGVRLAALPVEHDDARHPLQADEEVILAALVVMETPEDALAREREVGLSRLLRQQRLAPDLREPAALVLETAQRDPKQAVDHASLLTPVRWIRAPISSEGLLRAGVLPPARDAVARERPVLGVVAVDVGDLELASRRRLEPADQRRTRRASSSRARPPRRSTAARRTACRRRPPSRPRRRRGRRRRRRRRRSAPDRDVLDEHGGSVVALDEAR